MGSLIGKLTNNEFIDLVADSETISEIASRIGYRSKGGGVTKLIKDRIDELNIDISHFNKYSKGSSVERNKPLEEILVENSSYTNNTSLKRRLLKANLLKYECSICKISEWNNMPLSLQLDHVNGNNKDNRIENLRLLCPNCHSQTDTFSGRNATHN
jgi:5-methylcytosine-specific restriction endonuclease McrA